MIPGALLVTAALLAACSGSPAVGPLGGAGDHGWACAPARPDQTYAFGNWDLNNTGRSVVTIDIVRLGSPQGVTMTRAWLLPLYHDPKNRTTYGIGVWTYPPTSSPHSEWNNRQPAVGARIRPGQDLNLVFGVTRSTTRTGRSGGPVIVYTAGGSTFTLAENFGQVLADKCFPSPPRPVQSAVSAATGVPGDGLAASAR